MSQVVVLPFHQDERLGRDSIPVPARGDATLVDPEIPAGDRRTVEDIEATDLPAGPVIVHIDVDVIDPLEVPGLRRALGRCGGAGGRRRTRCRIASCGRRTQPCDGRRPIVGAARVPVLERARVG